MSQQSQEQYQFIENILKIHVREDVSIEEFQFFYGGNFNLAVRVKLKSGEFFIKWNQGDHHGLFEAEAKNLHLLHQTKTIQVPQVIGVGAIEEKEYLMMECIPTGEINATYWEDFGHQLALMHLNSSDMGHGLGYTNYLGAAEQKK